MIVEETVQNIYPISGTYQWARGGGGAAPFFAFHNLDSVCLPFGEQCFTPTNALCKILTQSM